MKTTCEVGVQRGGRRKKKPQGKRARVQGARVVVTFPTFPLVRIPRAHPRY